MAGTNSATEMRVRMPKARILPDHQRMFRGERVAVRKEDVDTAEQHQRFQGMLEGIPGLGQRHGAQSEYQCRDK